MARWHLPLYLEYADSTNRDDPSKFLGALSVLGGWAFQFELFYRSKGRLVMKQAVRIAMFPIIALGLIPQRAPSQPNFGERPPEFVSPEVLEGNRIALRIHAPNADEVSFIGMDIPGTEQGVEMKKAENGVWEVTAGPLPAGAYRYLFRVDGLMVVDPRNRATSETNSNVASLAYLPGSEVLDHKDVPHGAVAQVTYYSETLKRPRRMHVYTPPGYEKEQGEYPVLYLMHGAFDCDNAWSTVGRGRLYPG